MNWFLSNTTKYKHLDNFPNGWTGKELMELAENLQSSGLYLMIDAYTGYAPHITICSSSVCNSYPTNYSYYPTADIVETTTTYVY